MSVTSSATELRETIIHSLTDPLAIFILQLVVIIVMSRICAYLFKKIGQPEVMGEIIAGIVLGPSLLGSLFPGFTAFIFPASSLNNIKILSEIGLILFMFVVGMELDLSVIKKKAGSAFAISITGIALPFVLGIGLSYLLYERYAPANVPFYAFSLFIGIAMSITAFPVLARIIRERGLTNTTLGSISLTAAAAGDIIAWCALAFIIAVVKAGSVSSSLFTLISAIVYSAVMLLAVRPLLQKLASNTKNNKFMKRSTLALILITLLLSSWCCEVIGVHALFGAFMAGLVMPNDWSFRKVVMDKIEDVALVLLLPLFFVFTGLRTQVGMLGDASLWPVFLCIVFLAVVGKFGGSFIAARLTGENLRDSLCIGALMNTRGLVELVVLNIGYDLGILTAQMFTMLVLMALITTFMATPIINFIQRKIPKEEISSPANSKFHKQL